MTRGQARGGPRYVELVDRPLAVALVALGILVFGAAAFALLPISALPSVEYGTLQVEASLPGASAETMAATVASPLERELTFVPGLIAMSSRSEAGSTQITLQLSANVDLDEAGLEVMSSIHAATGDLPADLPHPPYWYRDNPADWSVLGVALTSDRVPLVQLDQYAESLLVRRAGLIDGVQRTVDWSRHRPAVRVEVDPDALAARGLSLAQLRETIQQASVALPKGRLDAGDRTATLSANEQLFDAEAIGRIVLRRDGGPVALRDVAQVFDGAENEEDLGVFDGRRAIALGFKRIQGANVVQTVDGIRAQLAQIRETLPPGVSLDVALDRSTSIRTAIRELELTLAGATLLVVAVILLFVGSLRATLIPSLAIPVSVAGTAIAMHALGFSLNILSLMALTIAIGFVVDDAIVVIENIARHVEQGLDPREAARRGVEQVGFTIAVITLSLVVVFVPVIWMEGVLGRLFHEFAITVSVAIGVSGVVAIALIPALCAVALRPPAAGEERSPSGLRALQQRLVDVSTRAYERSLAAALRHPRAVLASFAVTLLVTGAVYLQMPRGFFPDQDTARLSGAVISDPNLSPARAFERHERIAARLRADPEVRNVLLYGAGNFLLNLTPLEERRASLDEILERLRRAADDVPGSELYLEPQTEIVVGATWLQHSEHEYIVASPDGALVREWTPILQQGLERIPGIRDVVGSDLDEGDQVHVEVDRELAAQLGLDMETIDQTLYDAFAGRRVRQIFSEARQYHVWMRLAPQFRTDEAALAALRVRSDEGALVPLSSVARVQRTSSPLRVRHEGRMPAAGIRFGLEPGVALGDVLERIRAMERSSGKPASLQTSFGGAAGELERFLRTQLWLIGGALLVVYIVLGILYESALHPLTILSTLPSAGLGALLLLAACGHELDAIAVIGILLLVGIVKKNAIMVVDFALQAQRAGRPAAAAIHEACIVRFRPILMTTLAALAGAIPLAFASGPGFELRRPLGIAMLGGLLVSQALTLYTTPVIYLVLDSTARRLHSLLPLSPARASGAAHPLR